jgi:hypothetical protein
MSLTPAKDDLEARKKREAIELCGKNRGAHDYIPIEWRYTHVFDKVDIKRVTRLLCRVCFCNIETQVLIENYREVKS